MPIYGTGNSILIVEKHIDFDQIHYESHCCVHLPTTDAPVCFCYTHKHHISTVSTQMAETIK